MYYVLHLELLHLLDGLVGVLGGLRDDGEGGGRVVIVLAGHLQVLQVVLDIIQIVIQWILQLNVW